MTEGLQIVSSVVDNFSQSAYDQCQQFKEISALFERRTDFSKLVQIARSPKTLNVDEANLSCLVSYAEFETFDVEQQIAACSLLQNLFVKSGLQYLELGQNLNNAKQSMSPDCAKVSSIRQLYDEYYGDRKPYAICGLSRD